MVIGATLKRTSKEGLSTIREEVAFSWNISSKFDDLKFSYPVISAYERKPTKVSLGFFRTKTEVVSTSAKSIIAHIDILPRSWMKVFVRPACNLKGW